ncbi:MAG: hypothetical protein F4106_00530 [Gemmatimonadetes bacterium]|nr:hypothetical protein [Gemmatimonadota bacterium]MXX71463.1 hypothetical protein [Gemmatimonadota bacterium]MYC92908.1 hypothetical protein [Gemmatimonadota bacterium]MYG37325.1 hypothetical protein [Gemmatimonadota bacterium]MYJ16538.1 hypothetical protein [Gemmatimonadota bacterium]
MKRKQGLVAFWRELRRRHVVRAGGVYVASGFVVLQLGEIVLPAFNAPDWVLQSLVVLVFLGLPVVLAFAWVYDLTPEGLAKTREQQGGAKVTIAPRLALLAATSISVALGALWFLRSGATEDGGDGAEAVETAPPAAARTASLDPDAPITAIAVLPLADFAQRDDLFARQLHEEIITQLSLLSSLRVVSRTSVERYADSNMLLPDIAAELGVQAVVTGSVAMTSESDSVRISVQLLHAATDTHMLSRSFQRELKDILRLQTEVAVEIAESVQGELGDELSAEVEMVAEVDPEAYRAFLQGQQELERGTPEALEAALGHFDRSAELDPGYAQPLAWRAGTHLMLATDGDSVPEDVLAQVRGDLERAGLLGGAEDEVAATMVILRDRIGTDVSGIGAGIDDAFAQAGALAGFVTDSLRRRQLLESTRFGRQFGRGSPLAVAMGFLETGRFDSAAVAFEEILDSDPRMVPAWAGLEEAHLRQGHYEGAVEVREQRILATQGEVAEARAAVEHLHATFEEDDPASYWRWRQENNAQREARGEHVSEVEKAMIAVGLDQHDDALRHLEAAVQNRDPALVTLRSNAVWDPLRSDPRFQDVVRGVREVWRTRGRPPRPGSGTPDGAGPRTPRIP